MLGPCARGTAADKQLAHPIDRAYSRLYNFDFAGAHGILNEYIATHSSDPLGFAARAAALLFSELDRLMILETDFFTDNRRITEKKKLRPDLTLKQELLRAVNDAEKLAKSQLASEPQNHNALFALCLTRGILTDYTAFVEKRQFASLSYAKQSQRYAVRLLKADPTFYDAYLTTGMSEYLIANLPFFVRWFVRFDQVRGSRQQAVKNLELVAGSGRYLGPFAKTLLAVIHLREKRPLESERLLTELVRDYPENPLFRKELVKLSARGSR
jgi:hypothetical protein